MFKIEMAISGGWDDAEWTQTNAESETDEPMRFETREAAQLAIDEFIEDQHDAVDAGDMIEKYDPEDYRVAEVQQ